MTSGGMRFLIIGLVWAISLYALTYLHQVSLHSTKSDILSSLGVSRMESEVSKRASAPADDHLLHAEEPKRDSEGGATSPPQSMKGIYSGAFRQLLRRWVPAEIGEMDAEELIPWVAAIYKHMLWNSQLQDFDYDFFIDIGANRLTSLFLLSLSMCCVHVCVCVCVVCLC